MTEKFKRSVEIEASKLSKVVSTLDPACHFTIRTNAPKHRLTETETLWRIAAIPRVEEE